MIAFIFLLLVMFWLAVASEGVLQETCLVSLKVFFICVIILGAGFFSHYAILGIAYILKQGVIS